MIYELYFFNIFMLETAFMFFSISLYAIDNPGFDDKYAALTGKVFPETFCLHYKTILGISVVSLFNTLLQWFEYCKSFYNTPVAQFFG